MNVLAFENTAEICSDRRVRRACFESRSALPVSAACLTANAMREQLKVLLGRSVSLRLLAPVVPPLHGWAVLCERARIFRSRGGLCDAALIVRPGDALALCCAIFGEPPGAVRELSTFEAAVLEKSIARFGGAFAALTGGDAPLETAPPSQRWTTYFELIVNEPQDFRLGVALSNEPPARTGGCLDPSALMDVELELQAVLAGGRLCAGQVLALREGTDVPMKSRIGAEASLLVAGIEIARGTPGRYAGQHALSVNRTIWESATR